MRNRSAPRTMGRCPPSEVALLRSMPFVTIARRAFWISGALWICGSLLACGAFGSGGPLVEGEARSGNGQYPEAKQTLAALEGESRAWNEASRAEYALYRGLTLLALGDRGRGSAWLREAKAVEDAHPGTLPYDAVRRLGVAVEANEVP